MFVYISIASDTWSIIDEDNMLQVKTENTML